MKRARNTFSRRRAEIGSIEKEGREYLGDRPVLVAAQSLGTGTDPGGVFAWQNALETDVMVLRVLVNVTKPATAAATIDVGTDDKGDTSSDNLIDGLDVNAAAGLFDNIEDGGTNGKSRAIVLAGEFVVASQATGSVAGLEGSAYIVYVPV